MTNEREECEDLAQKRLEARQAIGALYIEVDDRIADDVREKVEAAFSAYEKARAALPRERVSLEKLAAISEAACSQYYAQLKGGEIIPANVHAHLVKAVLQAAGVPYDE